MSKIIAVMDTESKTLELTIDGSIIEDVSNVSLSKESYGDENYVEFMAHSNKKEGKIVKNTRYYTSGSEVKQSKAVDVTEFINSKKSHKSI